MWKLHKKSGVEFSDKGGVRGYTHMRVHNGYLIACRKVKIHAGGRGLGRGTKTYSVAIHRAVANLFIGPQRSRHVNHIDGNKHNNKVKNLEYVTRAGNAAHAHRTKLLDVVGESNGRSVLTERDVRRIKKLDPGSTTDGSRNFARRDAARQIAALHDVTETSVINVWTERTWKHLWKPRAS
jgi:hypothetical protein